MIVRRVLDLDGEVVGVYDRNVRVARVGDVALGHDAERVLIGIVCDRDGDLLCVLIAACEAVNSGFGVLEGKLRIVFAAGLRSGFRRGLCRCRLLLRAGLALERKRRTCRPLLPRWVL